MGKNKLFKFAAMESFSNVFYATYENLKEKGFALKGNWNKEYFKNDNPIVLELGCGKGEYAVGLAKHFPNKNFVGIDIKGARMYTGAKLAIEEKQNNVAFIRTIIEQIDEYFAKDEVSEIWITFPDPQMKKVRKRLTSTRFMELYRRILRPGGLVHLKCDSDFLYNYTTYMIEHNDFETEVNVDDLYSSGEANEILSIKTAYEQQWLERGKTIKYLRWVMHDKELTEPAVEIDFDDYRSFGRMRRSDTTKGI